MGIVRHLNGYRRIWMFPRNIRSIHPWKMAQILALMLHVFKRGEWNQSIQNSFCDALESAGLKRPGVQYDSHSGGPRTYFSQLKCLGLLFSRSRGEIYPTIAGKDLAEGKPPLPILQQLLLTHQYPSAYSVFPNVKINPLVKVKPFLFVLELLDKPEIGCLSNDELAVAIIYGHNHDCLRLCCEKISRIRQGCSLLDVIDDVEKDLYLPRSRADIALTIANVLDIANTCKNYMKACCLIYEDNVDGERRIHFNEDIRSLYTSAIRNHDKFIAVADEESFQRAYGAWNRVKDTRGLTETATFDARGAKEGVILSNFYKLCGTQVVSSIPDDFLASMASGYGFSRGEVIDIVSPHLASSIDFFEATFLESSRGGTSTAKQFELGLTDLMKSRFSFFAKHTGQLRRSEGVGGYADVFVVADDFGHCAILDAKASPSYAMSSDDYSKLVSNYIPNYCELFEKFDETKGKSMSLEFCSYVAGGFSGDMTYKLKEAHRATGVLCSAIRARDLLELAKIGISQSSLRNGMCNVKLLSHSDFHV